MIIFLYGPDTYRSRQRLQFYREGFKKKYDPSGLNVVRLDGEKLTIEELRQSVGQVGFLSKKRFVVVENAIGKNKNKRLEEEMVDYLEHERSSEDTVLVFFEEETPSAPGRKKAKKQTVHPLLDFLLQKKAEAFPLLYGEELNRWIRQEVKQRGGAIDNPAILELASLVGSDLWNMVSEIEKLINYKGRQVITADDVRLMVKAKFDENIFHLTDALAAKDVRLSFKLLGDQLASGAHELYLLTMLVRQFRILLQAREILDQESNYYTVAARLGLHPFVAQKAIRDARRFTLEELKKIYQRLLEIDIKIKSTGESPRLLFDLLVTDVCRH